MYTDGSFFFNLVLFEDELSERRERSDNGSNRTGLSILRCVKMTSGVKGDIRTVAIKAITKTSDILRRHGYMIRSKSRAVDGRD